MQNELTTAESLLILMGICLFLKRLKRRKPEAFAKLTAMSYLFSGVSVQDAIDLFKRKTPI